MTNNQASKYYEKMTMNDQNEKLSTLMDDYEHTDQDRSTLDDLLGDVNHQYSLRRYQMIGDVMRHELPERIQLDFVEQVMSRIDQEPALSASQTQTNINESKPGWSWSALFKPVAGLAVAASVAIVTISSLQFNTPPDGQPQSLASSDSSRAKVEQLARIPVIQNAVRVSGNSQKISRQQGMKWKIKRNEPDVQAKLNSYLVNHNEYSNSMHGIIPQARVAAFDGQR